MKRRRIRRNPVYKLDGQQEFSLIFGGDNGFEGNLQKRGAWYTHRADILEEFIPNHPGMRPAAWWEFEWKGEKTRDKSDEWELLIDEMEESEKALVLAMWVKLLHLRKSFLGMTYDHSKQKIGPYHGNPTWQTLCEKYDRQAALLGELAAKEWQNIKQKITDGWEAQGCSGCEYALDGGYCKQKQCKHWRDKRKELTS
jgi:hypothetical protein